MFAGFSIMATGLSGIVFLLTGAVVFVGWMTGLLGWVLAFFAILLGIVVLGISGFAG